MYGTRRTKLSRFRIFICSVSSHAYIHLIHRRRIKRIRVSVEQICGSISAIRCRTRHLSLLARCPLHYLAKPAPSNLGRTEWRIIVAERVCPELTTRRSDVWNTVLTLANERISWSRAMAQRSRIHWNTHFVRIMKVTSVSVAKELDGGKSGANTFLSRWIIFRHFCFKIDCFEIFLLAIRIMSTVFNNPRDTIKRILN